MNYRFLSFGFEEDFFSHRYHSIISKYPGYLKFYFLEEISTLKTLVLLLLFMDPSFKKNWKFGMNDQIYSRLLKSDLKNDTFMDCFLEFESSLYGNNPTFKRVQIVDVEFWIDRIVQFPSLRPLLLEKIVTLCVLYCEETCFREEFLEKCVNKCNILVYRLYQLGVYMYPEIEKILKKSNNTISYFYYRKEIENFPQLIQTLDAGSECDHSSLINNSDLDSMIQYGFAPSTIEYCLKYDDIDNFRTLLHDLSPFFNGCIEWSLFEWSRIPDSYDYLSVSALFGSIRCFKHLLFHEYEIDDYVRVASVCSGNHELYHLCNTTTLDLSNHLLVASVYGHAELISFLIEKGVVIDSLDICFSSFFLTILLFMQQHYMVIYQS